MGTLVAVIAEIALFFLGGNILVDYMIAAGRQAELFPPLVYGAVAVTAIMSTIVYLET